MDGTTLEFEKPIEDAISKVQFAPQSNNLLVSSWDSSLRLYEVESSTLRFESLAEAALLDCCFEKESTAFSAGSNGCITRYDLCTGTSAKIGHHDDIATHVRYTDEQCQLLTAGLDNTIRFWDVRQADVLVFVRNVGAAVETMAQSGFELVVCIGASVNIYDLRNLQQPFQLCKSHMDVTIRCASSIPYSRGYAIGSVDGRVALEFPNPSSSSKEGYTFRCYPKSKDGRLHLAPVNEIQFNPCVPGAFVTGDNKGYVISWDAQSRRRLFELPRYPNSVASLCFNHTGELLAVASSYTYQEATEIEEPPQIFIHGIDRFASAERSSRT